MAPVTPKTTFDPDFPSIVGQISGKSYVAVCGSNNSGKSYLLKLLKQHIGKAAYFVGPARFYHVNQLASTMRNDQEYNSYEHNFNANANNPDYNIDQNTIGLDRIVANLSDTRRDKLFEICGMLLGNKFTMKHFEDDNRLSPFYIDMDGQNISVGSSGTRLLMTLIGLCMDQNFNSLLIDEPELGLGPKVQLSVSKFLSDRDERKKYFPHLSAIVVSTHSQLFLDTRSINNNFSVLKDGNVVKVKQIQDFSELHNLQFNLLGNSLEALFLPSAFVFVEGKTDLPFIDSIVKAKFKNKNVVVLQCNGNVKGRVNALKESLHDIQKSPFRSRIFVIIDAVVPNPTLKQELVAMGLMEGNIIQWSRNGIEYFYPASLLAKMFGCDEDKVRELSITGDNISLNGIQKKKVDLSSEICRELNNDTPLNDEITTKFISKLSSIV
ncbi:hypothetical protein GCM10009416_04330 [Craurococcus roseus]|uniref:ATP-binding protein n=1 Tax=Craurococcus roseus TaxID=77585 RepID=A0ABP3PRS7_9PROT